MGCACGKGGGGKTIAQGKQAALSAASLPAGSTEADPLVIGEPGDVVRRVRVALAVTGMRIGNAYWVTGSGVDALIEDGHLSDITGVQQRGRQYKVGRFHYSDPSEAQRVASALGTTPIEVA